MANLSLKGICSLSHQLIDKDGKVNIHNIEMNQDDFEDCVMLTVEEAKQIDAAMTYLYMNSDVGRRYADVINKLLWRIKQAEKCDA